MKPEIKESGIRSQGSLTPELDDPRLFRAAQEYQAALGFLAGVAFLFWKSAGS